MHIFKAKNVTVLTRVSEISADFGNTMLGDFSGDEENRQIELFLSFKRFLGVDCSLTESTACIYLMSVNKSMDIIYSIYTACFDVML